MNEVEFGALFQFIRNGMNIKQDKSGAGLPISRIETIADSTINAERVGYAGLNETDCRNWLLEPGDILFSHINSISHIGKCAIYKGIPEKLVHGMNLLCLRCDREKVIPEFAKHLVSGPGFRASLSNFINKAVNQASVSISNLKSIPVRIPDISEQRRIATILDKADELRAKRRDAIARLDALTQAIFMEMIGDPGRNAGKWPTVPLAELIREGDSINYGVIQPGDDIDNGVPLVRVGNLLNGKVSHSSLKRISPSIESAYKRSRLRGDEVLVSCVGSTGIVALADTTVKGFNIARAVARIPLADNVSRVFMGAYLKTQFVQRYFTNELRIVSQPTLNIKQIAETKIVLPPANVQQAFERNAALVEKLNVVAYASLDRMDALSSSLQHRAFRGEL
jgi:type I restriction enzyme S subunit